MRLPIVTLVLSLGLNAAAQSPPASQPSSTQQAPTTTPATPSDAPPATAHGNTTPSGPKVSAARIRKALKRFAHEPAVDRMVRAALRAHRTRSDKLADMGSRARMAGWVPSLRLGARRGQAVDLSSTQSQDNPLRVSTDDDLTLQASLVFDLDRLVFVRDEVGIERERRNIENAKVTLVREVVRLYYLRRRHQLELALGIGDPLTHGLAVAETSALLNSFTNGRFHRILGL